MRVCGSRDVASHTLSNNQYKFRTGTGIAEGKKAWQCAKHSSKAKGIIPSTTQHVQIVNSKTNTYSQFQVTTFLLHQYIATAALPTL